MSDQNMSAGGDAGNDAAQTASPGDGATQTAQGNGAPAQNAPSGGDQTQGNSAPEEPKVDKAAIHDEMNVVYGKGYKGGIDKGKRDLAASYGFESVAAMDLYFKEQKNKEEQASQDSEAKHAAALRTIREENSTLKERLDSQRALNERLQAQSAAALRAEVKARAAGLGVIPDAADHFVSLVETSLAWAADGVAIEVITTIDGDVTTSHESLEDYLSRKKVEMPYMFKPPEQSGSATPNAGDSKPHRPAEPEAYDFRKFVQNAYGGGRT